MGSDPSLLIRDLGRALKERNRAQVNAAIRGLIRLGPPLGAKWKTLAAASKHNGELGDAWAAMMLYARDVGDTPQVRYELAAISSQMGFVDRAAAIMDGLADDVPDPASNAYIKGTIWTNLGDFAKARSQLHRAVAANPGSGQAWLALAMAGPISEDDSRALEAASSRMESSPDLERAAYSYALGKLFHERGQYAEAFEAFRRGADAVRKERPYNAARDRESAANAMAGWTPEAVRKINERLRGGGRNPPIFVTGLPRSGTTLVEQILVSHSAVSAGDELGLFRHLEQDAGGKSVPDIDRYQLRGGSMHELATLYFHLLDERFPGAERVVDKTLNSSRYIGLIMALFPEAPVVWLRRDPLDCAWSAYRTWFLRGLNWSWSLRDIAHHFNLEDALFEHWTAMFPDRILAVDYSQLVSDPRGQVERITAHCQLEFEAQQLESHLTTRTVTTASVTQVRNPINRLALDSSRPYREWLTPFVEDYSRGPESVS